MQPERLTLENICSGAVDELFQREIDALLENLADASTDAEANRSISMTFTFKPFKDRSGAMVEFNCKSKLAAAEVQTGQVFFSKQSGAMRAYPRDPRQNALFAAEPAVTPTSQ